MKLQFYLFFLFLSTTNLYAQGGDVIKGKISNKSQELLTGATIVLYSKQDTTKVIAYDIADENGEFSIELQGEVEGKYLKVSYLGYKTKQTNLIQNQYYYDIRLEISLKNLEEVLVKASAIRDTVRLKKDTMKFAKNTTLKELLKDNEGIEITEENGIKYMGVPINKILINKKEVFVNQNSIALDNITNEMVKGMQIINNYNDKFNVDFDNFDELVLNVDVKKRFKGVLKNIIQLGLGIEKAYSLEGRSFLFSDKLNIFLTQNTNSIGDKTNNTSEVKDRQSNASSFYRDNVTSISQGLQEVKEDNYNNSYLLLKKENNKSKIESNIGFNYSNQELEKRVLIYDEKLPLSEDLTLNNRNGNIFYADLYLINLISKDFSLTLSSNLDFVDNNLNWLNKKTVFPSSTFESNTLLKSSNFIVRNGINTKKIFHQKWLWENNLEYSYEETESNFSNNLEEVNQLIEFDKKQSIFSTSLFYQKSNLFNFGLKVGLTDNKESILSKTDNTDQQIDRNYTQINSAFIFKGQNSKSNYFINTGPQFFSFRDGSFSKVTFPISTSFNYKFSSRKSVSLSYENNYLVENLQNSLDNLYYDFTTLIKASDNTSNIQRNQSLTLNYNITNISKSINISFLAGGSIDYNFTQTNLFNFNSNINVYRRRVFNERNTIVLKHRFSKGYYFSKNDHKIQVEYTVSSSFSDSQIIQENELYPLSSEQYDGGLSLTFIPQNTFFNVIKLNSNLSINFIKINNNKVNAIQYNKNAISFNKTKGKHNYNLRFYSEIFNSQSEKLLRNDFELNYRFYLSKNTSLFLKGISILNLLGINENAGNLMTDSSSGLNITTINTNTFGYLITGIEFKL